MLQLSFKPVLLELRHPFRLATGGVLIELAQHGVDLRRGDAERLHPRRIEHHPDFPVDAAAVQQLVDAWLAAQNADDFAAYEKLYAPKMEGIKRSGPRTRRFDRAGWIADRKKMFDGKPMTVALRDLRIGGSAAAPTASFVQSFKQGNFADEGPKQLVLTRGPDGLRIAREELLASVIGGATPVTAGPIALVVEVDGKQHVVITGDADPAWGTGPIHGPFAGAHKYATRAASKAPPATPATPAHKGTAATDRVANGKAASACNSAASGRKAQAATSHSGGTTTPAKASGVTTSVTQGMAIRLARNPTTETCPNSSRLSGVSASVTTACSRTRRLV